MQGLSYALVTGVTSRDAGAARKVWPFYEGSRGLRSGTLGRLGGAAARYCDMARMVPAARSSR